MPQLSVVIGSSNSTRRPQKFILPAVILTVFILIVHHLTREEVLTATLPHNPESEHLHHNDHKEYTPPVPSVQHSVIRSDNVVWTFDDKRNWQSLGRKSQWPECWTYEDRYSEYEVLTNDTTALITNNNRPENKRAILLRLGPSQKWGAPFIAHVRSLVLEAGFLAGFDVIISVHLDLIGKKKAAWLDRVPLEFKPLVQTFSTQQLKDWMPKKATFKDVYEHNHTPVQMFMDKNQKYEFVYSVENDVRLIERWDTFLADVDKEYAFHYERQMEDQDMPDMPDLVSFESIRHPVSRWPWLTDACVKRFGGRQNVRNSLGVMWGWSRRLTDAMTQYNTEGTNCYFEYFAPSVAYQQNLTTFFYQHPLYCPRSGPSERTTMKLEELGVNDPRMVQFEDVAVGCTYSFDKKIAQPFWDDWFNDPAVCRPPALVHPVKGDRYN